MPRFVPFVALLLAGALSAAPSLAAERKPAAPEKKEPPSCAAITFRPAASGQPDGEQEAGSYRSRFGTMELMATIKSGEPQDYHLVVNGKTPSAFPGALPRQVEPCLKSKHVAVPVKAMDGACLGSRYRVVVDSSSSRKLLMLFGLRGDDWRLCKAYTAS